MNTTSYGRDDDERRRDALTIFQSAVDAADPERCVHGAVQLDGNELRVASAESPYDLSAFPGQVCWLTNQHLLLALFRKFHDFLKHHPDEFQLHEQMHWRPQSLYWVAQETL